MAFTGLLQTGSKKVPITEPLNKKKKNMAAATAAAPAAVPPAPLASASLYVGDLDAGITEPQVIHNFYSSYVKILFLTTYLAVV